MNSLKDFVLNNLRILMVIFVFLVTMYVQHLNNIDKLGQLNARCHELEWKIQDQYKTLDALKLDKSVFEVTMNQFSTLHTDIREIRADIKEILKNTN